MNQKPLYVATPVRSTGFFSKVLFLICFSFLTSSLAVHDLLEFLDLLISSLCVVRVPKAALIAAPSPATLRGVKVAILIFLSALTALSLWLVLRDLFGSFVQKKRIAFYPGRIVCSEKGANDRTISHSAVLSVTLNGLNGNVAVEYSRDGENQALNVPTFFRPAPRVGPAPGSADGDVVRFRLCGARNASASPCPAVLREKIYVARSRFVRPRQKKR